MSPPFPPDGGETWGGRPVARRIADAEPRRRVAVTGRIVSALSTTWRFMPATVCRLEDGSGQITVVFGGVRPVPGIVPGACIGIEATALEDEDASLVLWNPSYRFEDPHSRRFEDPHSRPRGDAG